MTTPSLVSITSKDMESEPISSTPQELIEFRKQSKEQLALIAYTQLVALKDLQAELAKLKNV